MGHTKNAINVIIYIYKTGSYAACEMESQLCNKWNSEIKIV